MAQDPRALVLALVELAVSKGTPPHEATAAAMAACKKIKEFGLLTLDFIEEGKEELVVVRIPFLILTQSSELYRVARLEARKTHSSHVLLIPKRFVRKVEMMSAAEVKEIGWGNSGSIISSLTLVKTYFEEARRSGWDQWR